jgi:hypothetical protein
MRISKAKQIEYRRNLVGDMLVGAKTHQEMAGALNVSRQTIDLDVLFLERKARDETRVLVEKKLPLAHLNALKGKVINERKSDQIKQMYLTLVSNSYRIRDDFLTDAKTVNDVLQFIDTNMKRIVDYFLLITIVRVLRINQYIITIGTVVGLLQMQAFDIFPLLRHF